jgi:hypothetical protein
VRPYLKNNPHKQGWENGSNGKAAAWQVRDREFNFQYNFPTQIIENEIKK